MANYSYEIAPQVDTHANWVSANPTLGTTDSGDTFGGLVISTGGTYGTILVYGSNQSYNTAYAAGQFIPLDISPILSELQVNGIVYASDGFRADTTGTSLSGLIVNGSNSGLILYYNNTYTYSKALIQAYNSGTTTYNNFGIKTSAGEPNFRFDTNGHFIIGTQASDGSSALQVEGTIAPGTDNSYDVGTASRRWDDVYATNGTIQTSDARVKTEVEYFSDDEINAAKELSKEIGIYKFLKAVDEKGKDARKHIGLTVQRAIEIMEKNNLNPFEYGFICYDEWEDRIIPEHKEQKEKKDKKGNVIIDKKTKQPVMEEVIIPEVKAVEAGNRYSFRYNELILFIMRGIEARLEALE